MQRGERPTNTDVRSYLVMGAQALDQAASHVDPATFDRAATAIAQGLLAGKAFLICGNGGSASDAMHITGELVGRFLKERRALRAICLSSNPAVLTAWSNDYSFETVFSRQVEAYGEAGGVLLGLSTSGNSINVVRAFEIAQALGMTTISLTGRGGGSLAAVSDFLLDVPSDATPIIQQAHICYYHYLCEKVELLVTAE